MQYLGIATIADLDESSKKITVKKPSASPVTAGSMKG
jgi:hypothetical protein